MADPAIASSPQKFTFGSRELWGFLTGFSGQDRRRSVDHVLLKHDAAQVEDMAAEQRRLDVRLVFTGATCAADFKSFRDFVKANPFGLLVHPTAGRWQAFCVGPDEEVDYGRALDEVQSRVTFKETSLDAAPPPDVPDAATAAQSADAQKSQFQKAAAAFSGALAKATAFEQSALAQIDAAVSQIDAVNAPVDFVRDAIGGIAGVTSEAIGQVSLIATKSELLVQDVDNFLAQAGDTFGGADPVAGAASAVDNLMGSIENSAQALEDEMISASATPAGCASAVADVVGMRAACWVVVSALDQARPPTVSYTVPELMDVLTVAMRTGPAATAFARASQILSGNRIPDPARIRVGTELRVPTA